MPRTHHYLKKARSTQTPSEIIVVDTETWHGDKAKVAGGERHRLRLGVALAYRYERGKRTRVQELVFHDSREFWEFTFARLSNRRPVWVFAHNAPYDLGILDGWNIIRSDDYECQRCAISQGLLHVKGYWKGKGLNFCDTGNYYHCSLAAIGKAVALPKLTMPEQSATDRDWEKYCRNDVQVTAKGLDALLDFIRENDLGPWQISIAGLAFSAFRRNFMKHKVLCHVYHDVLKMERSAYFGGLVDTNFVGRVPADRVWEVDVCSMYPAMCMKNMPSRLIGTSERISRSLLEELGSSFMIMADVTVESSTYRYPVRTPKGTVYPHGRFRTCLAHPELMIALKAGHVKWVHRCAWYEAEPIFADYMKWFTDRKIAYKNAGNDAFSTLCKYFANSLYGKMGQLTPQWAQWGPEAIRDLEKLHGLDPFSLKHLDSEPPHGKLPEETMYLADHDISIDFREYWGYVEMKLGHLESRDACPAVAACVTSYARVFLRECQDVAGDRNWYYSDTDSLWVNDEGKERLCEKSLVAPGVLGKLEVKGSYDYLLVHGPKDYETPLCCKLKGIKLSKTDRVDPGCIAIPIRSGTDTLYIHQTADGKYKQLQFPGAVKQLADNTPGEVFVRDVEKKLYRQITKCRVLDSGWTEPLRVSQSGEIC